MKKLNFPEEGDTFEVYQEMEGTACMVVDFNGYGFKTHGKLSPKSINRKLYKCSAQLDYNLY